MFNLFCRDCTIRHGGCAIIWLIDTAWGGSFFPVYQPDSTATFRFRCKSQSYDSLGIVPLHSVTRLFLNHNICPGCQIGNPRVHVYSTAMACCCLVDMLDSIKCLDLFMLLLMYFSANDMECFHYRLQLTHLPPVPHICVSESESALVQIMAWHRIRLVAYSAPSHYLNQWRAIANWTLSNKLEILIQKQKN